MGVNYNQIPAELKALPQWVCFNYEERTNNKGERNTTKVLKTPGMFNRSGWPVNAKPDKPETWRTFNESVDAYKTGKFAGIGFVLKHGGGFVFIDLDKCVNDDGATSASAQQIIEKFNNTYIERSVSGKGFHILCKGDITRYLPEGRTGSKTGKTIIHGIKEIEAYHERRFLTFTGNIIGNGIITECQPAIDWLYETYPALNKATNKTTAAVSRSLFITQDDNKLIHVIQNSKHANLWNGSAIGSYNNDESAIDQALMNVLPFYCRGDKETMRRIFSASALGQRDKWKKRPDYQERTIDEALRTWDGTIYDPAEYARQKIVEALTGGEIPGSEPEAQPGEVLDPGEWQPEDFRNREKLFAVFDCIYANDDDELLETLKNRASDLKITRITQRWTKYRDDRKKKESAAVVAEEIGQMDLLPEAYGLKTDAYHITTKGIIKEVESKEEIKIVNVIPVPVLPTAILTNVETGYVKTRLWWKAENKPAHEEIFENRTLADKSKVMYLADRGLPVNSTNALDVVEYLATIAAKNLDKIPDVESVSSLGWHDDNKKFSPYDDDLTIDNITENITVLPEY